LADNDNNNQNKGGGGDHNQQGKNKGGGGGGGNGLSCSGKFDAAAPGTFDTIKAQAVGHAANSIGFIGAMFIAAAASAFLKSLFSVKDIPAPQQGGGPLNPGQLTGGLFNLKKNDPSKFDEIMAKVNPPA